MDMMTIIDSTKSRRMMCLDKRCVLNSCLCFFGKASALQLCYQEQLNIIRYFRCCKENLYKNYTNILHINVVYF